MRKAETRDTLLTMALDVLTHVYNLVATKRLIQADIAKQIGVTQPTVSEMFRRFHERQTKGRKQDIGRISFLTVVGLVESIGGKVIVQVPDDVATGVPMLAINGTSENGAVHIGAVKHRSMPVLGDEDIPSWPSD